ncbi:hypothetical protein [Salinifilum ghardaiensis]
MEQDSSGRDEKHKNGESKVPRPPAGEGPTLEWFYPKSKNSSISGAILSAIVIVFLTIKDTGFSWMAVWWLWLFIVPWPFVLVLTERNTGVSAGADWVCGGKRSFVKTYDWFR